MPRAQHTLAHPEVPAGPYCYGAGGVCPHLSTKRVAGVDLAWCGLLKMGSIPNGVSEGDWEALEAHYGTHEWTCQETGEKRQMLNDHPDHALFLLWDSCKECGINDCDFLVYGHAPHRLFELKVTGWRREFPVSLRVAIADSPTRRFRALLKQLRRLRSRLCAVTGDIPLRLSALEGAPVECLLGSEADEIRLAGVLARLR